MARHIIPVPSQGIRGKLIVSLSQHQDGHGLLTIHDASSGTAEHVRTLEYRELELCAVEEGVMVPMLRIDLTDEPARPALALLGGPE